MPDNNYSNKCALLYHIPFQSFVVINYLKDLHKTKLV